MSAVQRIGNARREVALHHLKDGSGLPLLLLPELGEHAADLAAGARDWPGPEYGLDPSGHGAADWLRGGGYTPELVAADADVALAELGRAVLVGHGLGAYAVLLLAGARPEAVPAVILLAGSGLEGGGSAPSEDPESWRGPSEAARLLESVVAGTTEEGSHDPLLATCMSDLRPLDYVESFARAATRVILVEDGSPRPEWWQHVRDFDNARIVATLADALVEAAV